MPRYLKVAAAQLGPVNLADDRKSVVKRLIDMLQDVEQRHQVERLAVKRQVVRQRTGFHRSRGALDSAFPVDRIGLHGAHPTIPGKQGQIGPGAAPDLQDAGFLRKGKAVQHRPKDAPSGLEPPVTVLDGGERITQVGVHGGGGQGIGSVRG